MVHGKIRSGENLDLRPNSYVSVAEDGKASVTVVQAGTRMTFSNVTSACEDALI